VYFGYMIGGGELKIDPVNMEAIIKFPLPTNVTKVRILVGVVKYLQKFITSFLIVSAPLHAIKTSGKSF